jgi:hypothetical protein
MPIKKGKRIIFLLFLKNQMIGLIKPQTGVS